MALDPRRRVEVDVRLSEVNEDALGRLKSIGLDVSSTLERIRVATGTIDSQLLDALEATKGVERVEVSREVSILDTPPQLERTTSGSDPEPLPRT